MPHAQWEKDLGQESEHESDHTHVKTSKKIIDPLFGHHQLKGSSILRTDSVEVLIIVELLQQITQLGLVLGKGLILLIKFPYFRPQFISLGIITTLGIHLSSSSPNLMSGIHQNKEAANTGVDRVNKPNHDKNILFLLFISAWSILLGSLSNSLDVTRHTMSSYGQLKLTRPNQIFGTIQPDRSKLKRGIVAKRDIGTRVFHFADYRDLPWPSTPNKQDNRRKLSKENWF
ncbi:hypothetical protein CsSME_00053374 [Camellia sinensis var. sinensis]